MQTAIHAHVIQASNSAPCTSQLVTICVSNPWRVVREYSQSVEAAVRNRRTAFGGQEQRNRRHNSDQCTKGQSGSTQRAGRFALRTRLDVSTNPPWLRHKR